MKTLNLVAVAELINENTVVANTFGKKSFFKFHIQESVQDILDEIKENENAKWFAFLDDKLEDRYILSDKLSEWRGSVDVITPETLRVNCVNGRFFYFVTDNGDGTSSVEFNGCINALLQQEIIPTLTYIPGTLRAMYEGMYSFVSIEEYCEIRRLRNGDERGWGELLNKKFNNEIPCFGKYDVVEKVEKYAA